MSTHLVRFGGSGVGRILAGNLGFVGRILGIQGLARNSGSAAWGKKGFHERAPLPIEGCPGPDHGFWAAAQRRRIEIDAACILNHGGKPSADRSNLL